MCTIRSHTDAWVLSKPVLHTVLPLHCAPFTLSPLHPVPSPYCPLCSVDWALSGNFFMSRWDHNTQRRLEDVFRRPFQSLLLLFWSPPSSKNLSSFSFSWGGKTGMHSIPLLSPTAALLVDNVYCKMRKPSWWTEGLGETVWYFSNLK